jgi:Carboxypeptidase regulatory-like domain
MGVLALLLAASATHLAAQEIFHPSAAGATLPDAPVATLQGQKSPTTDLGTVVGTITDADVAAIPNAQVTLEDTASKSSRTSLSGANGGFAFQSVPAGTYVVRVVAAGFADWKTDNTIELHDGQNFVVPPVKLEVGTINTTVNAISIEELAEQQVTVEEHQRIVGLIPNFYVTYIRDAAPLTSKQKFKLAVVVSKDPATFALVGITAGLEHWENALSGYGQGIGGYAQRYAASYGDNLSSTFLSAAILPSLLHQDPRYFYRGRGSIMVRALYAISTIAICKGDNGHWQPNYSNVLGDLGSAGISTLYYPSTDRHNVHVTVDNSLIGVASGAFANLFQEFALHHFTTGAPPVGH